MGNDRKSCFVIMPSGNHDEYRGGKEESDFIHHDIIVPAIKKELGDDVRIIREIDNRNPGAITHDLIKHIVLADVSIVDITGQNPNVFLELGIRYALRKSTTILLRQETTTIPFDIGNYRCVRYSPFDPKKAITDIQSTINLVTSHGFSRCDSLVFDTFPSLHVEIPGFIKEPEEDDSASSKTLMPWKEYWIRLQSVVDRLRNNFQDGNFVPDLVLGISNGGLMYADLLGRELFRGIPILSLWADRLNPAGKYFDNSINNSIIEGIKSSCKPLRKILLVDDIVASGTTVQQAITYLQDKFQGLQVFFLPLFSRNQQYFDIIKNNIVWLSPIFNFEKEKAIKMHTVERTVLPYNKEIRST